jgi:hypothetical protein
MSLSEKATARIQPLPEKDQPISEQFRIIAKQWVELDGAARLLEEAKTATLSQMMKKLGDVPAAHAERDVKASNEWGEYIEEMVSVRTKANVKKLQMEFLRMKFSEWQSHEANARSERRL